MSATVKRARQRRPHPVLEQTYTQVAEDLGWSPADLNPPFDLDAFVAASYNLADARADAQ